MNKAILSAPFGTYLTIPGVTSTHGSYTFEKRPGAIWGALSRIQFTRSGIFNKMGLRNTGICSQNFDKHHDVIWSIAGFDYHKLKMAMSHIPCSAVVELNVSCPNAEQNMRDRDWRKLFIMAFSWFDTVIVKLPPNINRAIHLYLLAKNEGITHFHCCNTIKTDKGGLSGRQIQTYSLPIIEFIKKDSGIKAIGGGGIYSKDDVIRYRNAGADYFALGTICFMPWKIPAVLREINRQYVYFE